jgi:hypothetical protein
MSKMSDGGKGSSPRPFDVNHSTYENNWNSIFGMSWLERKKREEALQKMVEENERLGLYDNTGVQKNEYCDIITTEDCLIDSNKN